jgi:tRNA threonylcarbamoyladenosine biosynthesis protein TsaB
LTALILGFETATDDTAVCAARGGEVLYESLLGLSEKGGPVHATALLEEVEKGVEAAGGWEAVDAVAVGLGPGSFTGVRVGIATARALGLSRGLPVAGVCTLDALGRALAEWPGDRRQPGDHDQSGNRDRLVVLDARRGEIFAALYAPSAERLWDPLVCPPGELAERAGALAEPPLGAGSGAVRFRQELASHGVDVPDDADPVHRVAARHVCALAATAAGGKAPGAVTPIYLRPPDAERWRERHTSKAAD